MKIELVLLVDFDDAPDGARIDSPTVRSTLWAAKAAVERKGYQVLTVGGQLPK